MRGRRLVTLAALSLVTACAANPDKIAPVSVSTSSYASLSCREVQAMRDGAAYRLVSLSTAQRDARLEDTVNVVLWGIPTASLSGKDRSPEIAATKGQIAAMDARLAGC